MEVRALIDCLVEKRRAKSLLQTWFAHISATLFGIVLLGKNLDIVEVVGLVIILTVVNKERRQQVYLAVADV